MIDFIFTGLYIIILFLILIESIRHYFDSFSHFEDYYISVSIICIFIEYLIYLTSIILNRYDFHLAIMTHFLETFTYWFMLIFFTKQVHIKKRSTARSINLILIMFQILTFSCWGLFYNNPNILFDFSSSVFQKMGMIGVFGFDIYIESVQILMVIISLITCYRLKNNYIFLTIFFMLINEAVHLYNIIIFKNLNTNVFMIEQIFNGLSVLSLFYSIRSFYKNRNTFFKNKIKEKIV